MNQKVCSERGGLASLSTNEKSFPPSQERAYLLTLALAQPTSQHVCQEVREIIDSTPPLCWQTPPLGDTKPDQIKWELHASLRGGQGKEELRRRPRMAGCVLPTLMERINWIHNNTEIPLLQVVGVRTRAGAWGKS